MPKTPAKSLEASAETGKLSVGQCEVPYAIYRRPKRGVSLYVEPAGNLRLFVPMCMPGEAIQRLLDERRRWIARQLARLGPGDAPFMSPSAFKDGEMLSYLGQLYSLRITHNRTRPQGCSITDNALEINLHNEAEAVAQVQEDARLEAVLWYKERARQVLKERTDYWADKLGLTYRSLKVSNPMRRWGSCSGKNDIRYNWRVIVAASEIVDYLVVHELCHIAQKNHSKRFWDLVASALPDWRTQRDKLMRLNPAFEL